MTRFVLSLIVATAMVTGVGAAPPARGAEAAATGAGMGPWALGEASRSGPAVGSDGAAPARWAWPVPGAVVSRPYLAPATRYASGHRGVDLTAGAGTVVVAPSEGVVLFVGRVVDRGVMTLDVGGGVVITLEPVATSLTAGETVGRGAPVGTVDGGGHAAPGDLHLGVRVEGEYVDPMRFFGGTPRAVLLPCC